jgi:flagellar biosynthesis/type III secretory pathway ATPase
VGLAAGEPPARRGYPPSVFAALPRLLERTGTAESGSITAVYTVLVEGGDMDEPVADEVRGILDGHIVLSRDLASQGHYPAIDVTQSISRVMPALISRQQLEAAAQVRSLIALYEQKRDWILLGGYVPGADARLDRAVKAKSEIDTFLRQDAAKTADTDETWTQLLTLVAKYC